jgi:acyl carrier protein
MTIGSLTPLQQATPFREFFSIDDVRTLVAERLGVELEFVTSETHFTNDLGADLLDRVELMLAIEAKFAGAEIETRLPGWPYKIRTQKRRRKLSL